MAKALLGYRTAPDRRLMLEAVELRRRVRDLERLVARLELARGKDRHFSRRRHGVTPV